MRSLTLALVLATLPMAAQQTEFSNALFQVPAGWTKTERNGGVYLDAPESGNNVARIIMAPSQPLTGDFRTHFTEFVNKANAGQDVINGCDVRPSRADAGYDVLLCGSHLRNPKNGDSYRLYVAGHLGDRFESLMYIASSPEVFQRHRPAFEEFLKTISFRNVAHGGAVSSAPNAAPRTSPGNSGAGTAPSSLPGLYVTTSSQLQYNWATNGYNSTVNQEYYFFLPDGTVYYGLPKTGTEKFRCDRFSREDLKNCGTYQVNGSRIDMLWPNNPAWKPQHLALRVQPGVVTLGEQTLRRIRSEEGLRLDGKFGRQGYTAVNGSSGVASDHYIEFTRDGRFRKQGFVGYTGSTPSVGVATNNRTAGAGTYRVLDGVLELTYSDNQKEYVSFFRYPGEEEKVIVIDGVNYLRR